MVGLKERDLKAVVFDLFYWHGLIGLKEYMLKRQARSGNYEQFRIGT